MLVVEGLLEPRDNSRNWTVPKTLHSAHPSSGRAVRKEWLHPSRILSAYSSSARGAGVFALQFHSTHLLRRASDPKTVEPACREFVPSYCRLATASRSPESAPKQPTRAPSAPRAEPKVAELRRPPADNRVTWEKGEAPVEEHRSQRQRHPRNRWNLHSIR